MSNRTWWSPITGPTVRYSSSGGAVASPTSEDPMVPQPHRPRWAPQFTAERVESSGECRGQGISLPRWWGPGASGGTHVSMIRWSKIEDPTTRNRHCVGIHSQSRRAPPRDWPTPAPLANLIFFPPTCPSNYSFSNFSPVLKERERFSSPLYAEKCVRMDMCANVPPPTGTQRRINMSYTYWPLEKLESERYKAK